jgi:hypothetical protein
MRRELKIDKGQHRRAAGFRYYQAMDLRVPAESPALKMNAYPRGEVPSFDSASSK